MITSEAQKKYIAQWRKDNPKKVAQYQKISKEKKKPPILAKICKLCNRSFSPFNNHPNFKYCDNCRGQAQINATKKQSEKLKAITEAKPIIKVKCGWCEKIFDTKRIDRKRCSADCSIKAKKKQKLERIKERRANDPVYREKLRAKENARSRNRIEYYRSEKYKDRKSKYKKENPHIQRQAGRRRKARENGASGSHTEQQWQDKKLYHGDRCVYCGIYNYQLRGKYKVEDLCKLTRDHIKPLNKDGSDWIANIVPACLSCNSSKSDKLNY